MGEAGLLLSVRMGRSEVGSRLTCQTPTMALAMRIKRMTKGSTKAVTVSSPSSNQASTWEAGKGRMTGAGAPPMGKESKGRENTCRSEWQDHRAQSPTAQGSTPRGPRPTGTALRMLAGTGGQTRTTQGLTTWLVNKAQGTPRPTTFTATSI